MVVYVLAPDIDSRAYGSLVRGDFIYWHRQLPAEDLWTVAGIGQPWRDGNWFYELLLSASGRVIHERAIPFMKALLALIFGVVLFSVILQESKRTSRTLLICVLTAIAAFFRTPLEPSFLGLIFMIWAYGILRRGAFSVSSTLAAAGLFAIENNIHGTAILGVVCASSELLHARPKRVLLVLPLLAVLLVNPLDEIHQQNLIALWGHLQDGFRNRLYLSFFFRFDGAALLLLVALHLIAIRKTRFTDWSIVALLSAICAVLSPEYLIHAAVMNALALSSLWGEREGLPVDNVLSRIELWFSTSFPPKNQLALMWLTGCIFFVSIVRFVNTPSTYPVNLIQALQSSADDDKILHPSSLGGYLTNFFADAAPLRRVLVDERAVYLNPQQNRRLVELLRHGGNLSEFAWVFCRRSDGIFAQLEGDPDWMRVIDGRAGESPEISGGIQRFGWNLFRRIK